jgi:hypothetical protein
MLPDLVVEVLPGNPESLCRMADNPVGQLERLDKDSPLGILSDFA